ncbi:MAG: hypothetical protein M1834_008669 [Cirrosporium novae-zelandiae]|nr:MAG: hypothetical protein M1834_008669 [Cirrosporium novae-zelandiae]
MFRNRQNFPEVTRGAAVSSPAEDLIPPVVDSLKDAAVDQRPFGDQEDLKLDDATPRVLHDTWRLTPSLLDPNSFAFSAFANQPPGYYTPTPGGYNTIYHPQAGDLHTPTLGMSIHTPLSLPHTENVLHPGSSMDLHNFQSPYLPPAQFHPQNVFLQPPAFAPTSLFHQDSGYSATDRPPEEASPQKDLNVPPSVVHRDSGVIMQTGQADTTMSSSLPSFDKFRYHVTLNAPTAMIKHSDEVPVTYLNKGQAYSISVIDKSPPPPGPEPLKYRTFIRVSFEDEQQRQRPSQCWQLWKEGRGSNEAHQRGGKLQAVEYVEQNQGGDDETRKPRVELESSSFDGFSVIWSPNSTSGTVDYNVAVRFNFLSTDFSHSKGVKGIPVRLCAKTQILSGGPGLSPDSNPTTEICYCKVKLFRDHGAERKLTNDVAHVKKTIDKLKQQITQVESGMRDFGKRKRSGSITSKPIATSRPGKVQKHKRTWSVSSQSSTGGGRAFVEEDLHMKLLTMQDMFTSTHPVSVLYLKGDELDDPDLHPVQLSIEQQDVGPMESISRTQSWEQKPSTDDTTSNTSNIVSPTPSSLSLVSQTKGSERQSGLFHQAVPFNVARQGSEQWANYQLSSSSVERKTTPLQHSVSSVDAPVKVQKGDGMGALSGWIEALGVDSNYKPPTQKMLKPVACIYVLIKIPGKDYAENDYYRAVYLMRRSVQELVHGIASKSSMEPARVTRVTRINPKGIKIVVDEEVVRLLPEGQDMIVEFSDIQQNQPVKNEWEGSPCGVQSKSDVDTMDISTETGVEMKLIY